ncbi:hypothetical protein VDG1235_2454 [Verrucomicrobiia bacterium DG1235]|nr:hypothetical protein VDG1235_2454 [Verrucomicrobiae bacterium DG1235]
MKREHNESDWKRFGKIVPELRERYLEKKNKELLKSLSDAGKTPTEQFWDTFEKMKKEKKILEDCLDGHSRSKQFFYMVSMCSYGMMRKEDLDGFSEELKSSLAEYIKE